MLANFSYISLSKGGRARIQSPVWLIEPESSKAQLHLPDNWNGLSGEIQLVSHREFTENPDPHLTVLWLLELPPHIWPPALEGGDSPQRFQYALQFPVSVSHAGAQLSNQIFFFCHVPILSSNISFWYYSGWSDKSLYESSLSLHPFPSL